ncbi:BZ3500_MvSof-1268-A1-R1_Chr11-1g03156 [Microbotryum saponariae]|uniref:BZ3500_MvSof-1268-A1-R1_Chr11-1g03156 protein n=1 Tax=Microbotryum saponariae TaxID=289078 RepID=A0A2X0NEE0_9BASI|nr:BZ3501_MvSof-1269-A2-R1_Chr11g02731 [Microbotryum saponariae]SDA03716.1 BZ3500_MvSof-1268-A1-R1_Chr11-1g03156 [Microbotryum saponariae]
MAEPSKTTSTESAPLRIAIVGGGIAGLTAAIAVLHYSKQNPESNVRLDVYESAAAFAEIGAGVALGPNAQTSLRLIGCGEALERIAGKQGQSDDDLWFDFLVGAKDHPQSGKDIHSLRGKMAGRGNVHRYVDDNLSRFLELVPADFLDGLIQMLPTDQAHFKKRCINYTPHSSGVTLHFADSTTAEADVLVASDGIKSVLREAMYVRKGFKDEALEIQRARYSEWIAWRGMVERAEFERIFGKGASDKRMLLGQGRHILHFPVRGGALINIVAFVKDPAHAKLGGHTGPWWEARPKAEMLEDFASFNESSLELLKAIKDPSIWGIFELPLIPHAVDERIVLVGDAAHATTPHQGSGAGQAIEDGLFVAHVLTHPLLSKSSTSSTRSTSLRTALSLYEAARHPRGRRVQSTSYEAGLLYDFLDPVAGDDIAKIEANLSERMKWIWEINLEKELSELGEELGRLLAQ